MHHGLVNTDEAEASGECSESFDALVDGAIEEHKAGHNG